MNLLRYFLFYVTILTVITTCKNLPKNSSKVEEIEEEYNNLISTEPPEVSIVDKTNINLQKITYLKKIGEIKDGFSDEEINYFAKIDDICVNKNDDLFVADSKLHKIFKFNKNHKFLLSFGQVGQGPGELAGNLRIKAGNDENLYVSDFGNKKFCIFSSSGGFIRQFSLPTGIYDHAVANYSGNIFFISEGGLYLIDCYDSTFKYLQSLLDIKYHHTFPIEIPPKGMLQQFFLRPPRDSEIIKVLSQDDHLFVTVNNSQVVVCFDQKNNIINKFRIDHPTLIKDYKNRLQEAKRKNAWINCIGSVFFDNSENICFCYYNASLSSPEIYRYQRSGKFVDIVRIEGCEFKSNRIIRACDSGGNFFAVDKGDYQISIYCIDNNKN